ncbi:TfoX/Sxy family protein [Reyranella sp. CPCC 100927]|nr:TfoX/Sxy family protein [Reyranella sp. CPCC 100927]TWT12654.1 TfoX/Sxy family protein [Reyranella sp. CPCC 100927]
MPAGHGFTDFLFEQLTPLGHITARRMFGKTGVFCDGVMLGMIAENTLYLRVDDHSRAFFQEASTSAPLNYKKAGTTIDLAFWRIPDRLIDEPEELVAWARVALAAAKRVSARRPRRAK